MAYYGSYRPLATHRTHGTHGPMASYGTHGCLATYGTYGPVVNYGSYGTAAPQAPTDRRSTVNQAGEYQPAFSSYYFSASGVFIG